MVMKIQCTALSSKTNFREKKSSFFPFLLSIKELNMNCPMIKIKTKACQKNSPPNPQVSIYHSNFIHIFPSNKQAYESHHN